MPQLPPPSATRLTEPPRGRDAPTAGLPALVDLSLAAPPRVPGLDGGDMPKPTGSPVGASSTSRPSDTALLPAPRPPSTDWTAYSPQPIVDLSPKPVVISSLSPLTWERTVAPLEPRPSVVTDDEPGDESGPGDESRHDDQVNGGDVRPVERLHADVVESTEDGPPVARSGVAVVPRIEHVAPAADRTDPDALPPPAGSRSVYALARDPWAVGEERRHRERQARRARRRRLALALAVPLVIGLAVTAWFVVPVVTERVADEPIVSGIDVADATATATTIAVAPEASAEVAVVPVAANVDDVWLLDRGDGDYDWGAVVVSTATEEVGINLDIEMTLLDSMGNAVFVEDVTIVGLGPGSRGAIGGIFEATETLPVRIELVATEAGTSDVDVDVDDVTTAEVAQPIVEYQAIDVRRVPSGQVGRDDRLLGTVQLGTSGDDSVVASADRAPSVIRVAALWRDDEGAVIAASLDELEPAVGAATAEFSLRLRRVAIPSGPPDEVVVSVGT